MSSSSTIITTILSSTLQTISNLFLRQVAIFILFILYYSSSKHLAHHPTWKDNAFKRVWWVALGWAAAEAVVGVKQGYESIALYNHRYNGRKRESTGGAKETKCQWKRTRTTHRPPFLPFEQQYMFTKEAPPGELQSLLRTLTRLDDDSERRGEGFRSIDSLEEPGRIGGGIPVIVTFFFLFLFSSRIYLIFVLHTCSAPCSYLHRINSIISSLGICPFLTHICNQHSPSSPRLFQ